MEKLDLQKIRHDIDTVDKKLAQALEERLQLVLQVAEYKRELGLPVRDLAREEQVIAKVTSLLDNQDYAPAVAGIMRSIIDAACSIEEEYMVIKKK